MAARGGNWGDRTTVGGVSLQNEAMLSQVFVATCDAERSLGGWLSGPVVEWRSEDGDIPMDENP